MQKDKTKVVGAASDLSDLLDFEDGLMCVFVDNTEISHYLMMHINDQENLEGWQNHVCQVGAITIDRLRAEIKKLRADAERYRYLRATTNFVTSNGEKIDVKNNPDLWDLAIDKAIREQGN